MLNINARDARRIIEVAKKKAFENAIVEVEDKIKEAAENEKDCTGFLKNELDFDNWMKVKSELRNGGYDVKDVGDDYIVISWKNA